MDFKVNLTYKYITLLDSEGRVIQDKEIISSKDVNNELLAMTYGFNFNENGITTDMMNPNGLTAVEIAALAECSVMQFDHIEDYISKFEYKSLLNKASIINMDLDKDVYFIEFRDEEGNKERIDISKFTDCKKLVLCMTSPEKIRDISVEIHENMLEPHIDVYNDALFIYTLQNESNTELITEDLVDMRSGMKLGDESEQYNNIGDTQYIKGIYDSHNDSYIVSINMNGKCI